ncbi:MAG: phenylalanine--tRNA ligase subunit alpha [Vampirovibrionales bacterium]
MPPAPSSSAVLNQQVLESYRATLLPEANTLNTMDAIEAFRLQWLGRSGELTLLKRVLKDVPAEDRPQLGLALNELSNQIEACLNAKKDTLEAEALQQQLLAEQVDVTLPGSVAIHGNPHPLTRTMNDITRIFESLSFSVLPDNACPEVETEYYNFEALNFADDHPARDMQDTYYTNVGSQVLLRSQTSNAQIRYMAQNKPPFRVVAPGRVFRNEDVSSRKYVLFHQIEGMVVDTHVTFADLKGTLNTFLAKLFGGEARKTRFRPSYFPFTEPSAEVDVECIFCHGKGCSVCSHSGWLEILGAGMIHPNVLRNCGIDPEVYQGFAFGMGVERLAMLRDAIDDIRLFYDNDQRYLAGLPKL